MLNSRINHRAHMASLRPVQCEFPDGCAGRCTSTDGPSTQKRKTRCDARRGSCLQGARCNSECRITDRITGRTSPRGHTESLEQGNATLQKHLVALERQLREAGFTPHRRPCWLPVSRRSMTGTAWTVSGHSMTPLTSPIDGLRAPTSHPPDPAVAPGATPVVSWRPHGSPDAGVVGRWPCSSPWLLSTHPGLSVENPHRRKWGQQWYEVESKESESQALHATIKQTCVSYVKRIDSGAEC